MQREYQGFIFTKHALERAASRSISQEAIVNVLKSPELTQPSEKPNSVKFIKTINQRTIHVVATQLKEERTWLVISVWVRGEDDQQPIMWRLITWPFRAFWQALTWGISQLRR